MEHHKRGKYLIFQVSLYVILFLLAISWKNGFDFSSENISKTSTKQVLGHLRKPLSTEDYPLHDPMLGPPTYEDVDGKWRIIFHIMGIFYMFTALSIVVDEYFCSALNMMVETWKIKEDVAGATFMAAGGSAPELFTSILGVFVAKSDVGFGTIIGSAVFNVLFVIGLCAAFAKEVLQLTWWPLFRDCSYYIFGLCTLAGFVGNDGKIHWYEALILFIEYCGYCMMMYHNADLEKYVGSLLERYRIGGAQVHIEEGTTNPAVGETGSPREKDPASDRESSKASLERHSSDMAFSASTIHLGSATSSILDGNTMSEKEGKQQVHPYSPSSARSGSNGEPQSEASFRRIARDARRRSTACFVLEVRSETIKAIRRGSYGGDAQTKLENKLIEMKKVEDKEKRADIAEQIADLAQKSKELGKSQERLPNMASAGPDAAAGVKRPPEKMPEPSPAALEQGKVVDPVKDINDNNDTAADQQSRTGSDKNLLEGDDEDEGGPFEMPEGTKERVMFFVTLPLVFLMHFTVPNCAEERWAKFFMVTFGMSLIWIAVFSYLLVWWVSIVGEVIHVDDVVLGLTVIAAGTSIPDALSSVIMARMGQGDMAVSSSIGSNVFDILVGLPIPWFIYTAMVFPGKSIVVESPYLVIHTLLLLFMVFAVVLSIMYRKWKLDYGLGGIMLILYFIFLVVALYLELAKPQSLVI